MMIRSLSFTSAFLTGLILAACFSPSQTRESGSLEETAESSTESSTNGTSGPFGGGSTQDTTTSSEVDSDANTDGVAETSTVGTSDGTTATVCGDGVVGAREVCDDGTNDGEYGGCLADCSAFAPRCGDGDVTGPEDCDDSDEVNGNGCNNNCVASGTVLWTIEGAPSGLCGGFGGGAAADSENGILVAKMSECDGQPLVAWLGKYGAEGGLIWSRTWGTGDAGALAAC